MDRDHIYERLVGIFTGHFGQSVEDLRPEATLRGTLLMDDLDLVDLAFFVKRTFGVHTTADEYRDLRSIAHLVAFIESRTRRAA
jgi:acyl carrier protein